MSASEADLSLLIFGYIRETKDICHNISSEIIHLILVWHSGDEINPNPSMIETTQMKAERLNEYVFAIRHCAFK